MHRVGQRGHGATTEGRRDRPRGDRHTLAAASCCDVLWLTRAPAGDLAARCAGPSLRLLPASLQAPRNHALPSPGSHARDGRRRERQPLGAEHGGSTAGRRQRALWIPQTCSARSPGAPRGPCFPAVVPLTWGDPAPGTEPEGIQSAGGGGSGRGGHGRSERAPPTAAQPSDGDTRGVEMLSEHDGRKWT